MGTVDTDKDALQSGHPGDHCRVKALIPETGRESCPAYGSQPTRPSSKCRKVEATECVLLVQRDKIIVLCECRVTQSFQCANRAPAARSAKGMLHHK